MPKSRTRKLLESRGALVAQVVAGSWRREPPPLEIDLKDFIEILPLLISSGSGALAWKVCQDTPLGKSEGVAVLGNVYRACAIYNLVHLETLKAVFTHLRLRKIEPILVKGWSIGRLYCNIGRRPYGDIDLCVRPDQYREAERCLKELESVNCDIDLHSGFAKFYETDVDEDVWSRTTTVDIDGTAIRILSDEDQLRYLCLHLLRHGANRVLWGCDIGVALETRPDIFDWDLVLRGSERERNWVVTALTLASNLLGARLDETVPGVAGHNVPAWIESSALAEWGKVYQFPAPLALSAGNPRRLLRELPKHWPNGIMATLNLNREFKDSPPLVLQLSDAVSKGWRVLLDTHLFVRAPSE